MGLPDGCCLVMQAELLTQLGRPADAVARLELLETARRPGGPGFNAELFLADPALRPLWHDPAIEPFLRRNGLIDYWRASETRPDACRKAGTPAFCRLLTR